MQNKRVSPEDLMEGVIAADAQRRQLRGEPLSPPHPRWKRVWLEPLFNIIGAVVGQGLAMLPWPLRWRADQKVTCLMGARPSEEFVALATAREEVAKMARRLHQETGQWPASLFLTSHPETTGPFEWLRFELVREGLLLANTAVETASPGRWYPPAPKCFLAIDPYALDTVPTAVAGLYAAFMHRIYLVWDRQSETQGWLQRHWLLRHTGYARIGFRLLASLRRGAPVIMVLPGGLPHNARIFYAAREFVHRLPVARWPYSKRLAQKKWMDVLARPVGGVLPIVSGALPVVTRAALRTLLREWGIPEDQHARWLEEFEKEFQLAAPYRARLFQILMKRLVARGTPLLWIALAHREKAPYVQVSAPWGAYRTAQGDLRLIKGAADRGQPIADVAQLAKDFSREFVV